MQFAYPVDIEIDALSEALAARMLKGDVIPSPSPARGRPLVVPLGLVTLEPVEN